MHDYPDDMPEMPEVEGLRAALAAELVGATITRADLAAFSALKTYDPPLDSLRGGEIVEVCRFGKFLACSVHVAGQPLWLVVHLAHAGWLHIKPTPARPVRLGGKGPLLLRVAFADHRCLELTEAGTQRHAAVWLVHDPAEVELVTELGPDPLSERFTSAEFTQILTKHGRARLKTLLRDQRVISGIGNGWSDEILHTAKLSPYATGSSLTDEASTHLWTVIRDVLEAATERAIAASPEALKDTKRAAMRVHGRTGEPCPVCGDQIAEVSFSDSSWQYCPTCQTDGKPLADRRMSRLLK